MKTLRWLAVAVAACLMSGVARAEDDLAKTLVGKWVVTKSEDGGPPAGTVAEFTKDGKVTVTMKKDDKDATMEGTYKCEAKKFTCTFKTNDKNLTMPHDVVKISADEMIFTVNGKSVTAKKKS